MIAGECSIAPRGTRCGSWSVDTPVCLQILGVGGMGFFGSIDRERTSMSKPTIFIPQPIPAQALEALEDLCRVEVFPHLHRHIERRELLEAVRSADILFGLSGIAYDAEVLGHAGRLRLIAAMHMNPKFIDLAAATARGVPVAGIPNMLVETTAEFTVALVMATMWRLPEADRFVRDGRWKQNQSMAFLASRIFDKTIGIVGLGEIGSAVASRLRPLCREVVYTKRSRLDPADEDALGVRFLEMEDLFKNSDVVVLTPALTAATRGLVGGRLLGLMKPTAVLVNTSRGAVVDEAALESALADGRLAGAGLDVFEREVPHIDGGPRPGLLEMPNVVVTPHMGSAARETRTEMALRVVANVRAFLATGRPIDLFNPEIYGEAPIPDERVG